MDLEKWPEHSKSLTRADRDHLNLLRLLSAEARQPNGGNAAVLAYFEVHYEIEALIDRKNRTERQRTRHHKVVKPWRHWTDDQRVRLVHIKAYELGIGHPRRSRQEAEWLALQDFKLNERQRRVMWEKGDLSPVELRAMTILNGASRNAKKNFREKRAIRLADGVIAEWCRPRRRPGRPAGSKIKLARKTIDDPKLASVAEVIEAILPIIEQLAGSRISSSPGSTMIKAGASAVRSSANLTCTPSLAASIVRALHRTAGPPTP